jgi:hypothetical protein
MLFKFPQKKIVLDCFTALPSAIEYAPIHYAIKHIPDWWKNLPAPSNPSQVEMRNMRNCAGMVDYYKKSIAIPLWTDFKVSVKNKIFIWEFADQTGDATQHTKEQAKGFLDGYQHLKINSPWLFKSEKNMNWVWSHPTYNYSYGTELVSLPGITEFYYQNSTNINFLLDLDEEQEIFIRQGQPLALLTPMSDRKVEIVRHLISQEEFLSIYRRNAPFTFVDKYKSMLKRKEQFSDCPFHNHIKGK